MLIKLNFALPTILVCAVATTLAPMQASAQSSCQFDQVKGTVYRDFNANGTREAEELPAVGISVQAFNAAGNVVGSTTTNSQGTFSLSAPAGAPVRVEFDVNPALYSSGRVGPQSLSSVVFLDTPGKCDVSFGLSNPTEYCVGPRTLAATCFVNGNPLSGGSSGDLDAMVTFPYDATGTNPRPAEIALAKEIGSTWGLAYQRSTQKLFASSFLKRHTGYGPLGSGGIYVVDLSSPTPHGAPFVDLRTLGVNTGVDPRTTPGDPGLPSQLGAPSYDPNVFAKVGTQAFGDLEISSDEKTLWVVNLFERKLVEIFIDSPARVPTTQDIHQYAIPNPGCSNGDFKPFGLTLHEGKVFVGVSCSAETSQDANDLKAMILSFDGTSFSTLFQFSLDYPRGYGIPPGFPAPVGISAVWRPFPNSFQQVLNGNPVPNPGGFYIYPNAVVSAFNFLRDGSLVISVMDIFGHRGGPFNYAPEPAGAPGAPTPSIMHTPPSGDILLAGLVNGSYVLESNTMITSSSPLFSAATAGQNNGQGPGNGERFYGDTNFVMFQNIQIDAHQELSLGGLFVHPAFVTQVSGGSLLEDDIIDVTYNPENRFESAGIREFSLLNGGVDRAYEVYHYDPVTDPGRFGKAAGLGDLEMLCSAPPLEIGNRVWLDTNKNGVQDAGEPGIAGVTVRLYDDQGQQVASTSTSANGSYYFRSEGGLKSNSTCTIKVDNDADYLKGGPLGGLVLTTADSGGKDSIDSDATAIGGKAVVGCQTGAPGQNNHTYDIGFQAPVCQSVDNAEALVQLDAAGVGIRNLTKSLATRIRKLSKQGPCSNKTNKQLSKILADQEAAYLVLWNAVWTIPTKTDNCQTTPLSCKEVELSSISNFISVGTQDMVSRLEVLLGNTCFKSNEDRKRVAQYRKIGKKVLSESNQALKSFQGSVRTCAR